MISSSSLSLKHYLWRIRYFIGPVCQLESAWIVFVGWSARWGRSFRKRGGNAYALDGVSSINSLKPGLRVLMEIVQKRLLLTRLVTRTKESTPYASLRVEKPEGVAKASTRCEPQGATPANLDSRMKGLSKSIFGRTRKMVNYAWVGWSQGKLWWRLEALLTCKSFVKLECRGERLIEPSSSWFLLKFLSG